MTMTEFKEHCRNVRKSERISAKVEADASPGVLVSLDCGGINRTSNAYEYECAIGHWMVCQTHRGICGMRKVSSYV